MRFMFKAILDTAVANAATRDGTMGTKIAAILDDLKPEAAYFLAEDGNRTAVLFLDIQDPSQLPAVAEPWFLLFNARIEAVPAMTSEDLANAGPGIERAVKNFG